MISPRSGSAPVSGRRDFLRTAKWAAYGAAICFAVLLLLAPGIAGARGGRGHFVDHRGHHPGVPGQGGHGTPPWAGDWSKQLGLDWYDITNQTVTAAGWPEPVTASRAWATSWLAAARAVEESGNPAFEAAAFAQALHDALAAQVPSQTAALDADLASTLGGVPNGPAKSAGIVAGQQQAAAVLAQRSGDGLDTASLDIPFTPPSTDPGVWQPTPPKFTPGTRAGEGNARPFLLTRADQFDPGSPPALNSATYRQGLEEVRDYGSATGSLRTPEQTDVALFWFPALNGPFEQVLRAVLADTSNSLAWQTRFVAAFQVVTTDAQIAIYNGKYKYVFWRPVTAIHDDAVDPDPSWTPLSVTPTYPDWPSGHGGYVGAAQAVLTAFLGPNAPAPIPLTSTNDPGVNRTYTNWSTITQEVIDARVWEGVHFRFSDVAGARLGLKVGGWDLAHLWQLGI